MADVDSSIPQSHRDYAASKEKIFGKDPVLDATGQPMERGQGSAFARMHPSAKAHFLTQAAHAAADDVAAAAKNLDGAVARLVAANKEAVAATAKAVEAPVAAATSDEAAYEADVRAATPVPKQPVSATPVV